MKLTSLISALALSAGVLMAALPVQAQGVVRSRLQNQQRRIRQGVRSGDLSRSEARKLRRNHRRLVRHLRRDRRTGNMSPAERARLNRQLDRQGREIKHQRSDDEKR